MAKFVLGDSQYHCTLDEIAAELGVHRERVRQIQQAALAKLRKGLEERGFTAADIFGDDPEADDCRVDPPMTPKLPRS